MVMFRLTPDLLQKGLTALGVAAGQMKQLDDDTKTALGRFVMAALGSGDANGYIKSRLAWLEERDQESPERATAKSVRVTSRPLEAEFVDEPTGKGRRR